jgi:hypothetical protein
VRFILRFPFIFLLKCAVYTVTADAVINLNVYVLHQLLLSLNYLIMMWMRWIEAGLILGMLTHAMGYSAVGVFEHRPSPRGGATNLIAAAEFNHGKKISDDKLIAVSPRNDRVLGQGNSCPTRTDIC